MTEAELDLYESIVCCGRLRRKLYKYKGVDIFLFMVARSYICERLFRTLSKLSALSYACVHNHVGFMLPFQS